MTNSEHKNADHKNNDLVRVTMEWGDGCVFELTEEAAREWIRILDSGLGMLQVHGCLVPEFKFEKVQTKKESK